MQRPFLWNTLDEAAAWLSESTGKPWTEKSVIDAAMKVHVEGFNHRPRPTLIKAAPPPDTKFSLYKWDTERGSPQNPFVRVSNVPYQTIPLSYSQLALLLVTGEAKASMVQSPSSDDGCENEYIFIEPLGEQFTVTLEMLGLSETNLKALARLVQDHEPRPPALTTDKANKWDVADSWEQQARAIGLGWMLEQRKLIKEADWPGVEAIAKHVEGELSTREITGKRGKYLDWETIKREALTGITGRKAKGKK